MSCYNEILLEEPCYNMDASHMFSCDGNQYMMQLVREKDEEVIEN